MPSRVARASLLAGAVVVTGLMGCDSTPSPPPAQPSASPAASEPGEVKKAFKANLAPIKGRPQQPAAKP